jgi:hypothetical protein
MVPEIFGPEQQAAGEYHNVNRVRPAACGG